MEPIRLVIVSVVAIGLLIYVGIAKYNDKVRRFAAMSPQEQAMDRAAEKAAKPVWTLVWMVLLFSIGYLVFSFW